MITSYFYLTEKLWHWWILWSYWSPHKRGKYETSWNNEFISSKVEQGILVSDCHFALYSRLFQLLDFLLWQKTRTTRRSFIVSSHWYLHATNHFGSFIKWREMASPIFWIRERCWVDLSMKEGAKCVVYMEICLEGRGKKEKGVWVAMRSGKEEDKSLL